MKRLAFCLAVLLSAATCYAQCGPDGCGPGGCPTGPQWQPPQIGVQQPPTIQLPAHCKESVCRVTNYESSGRRQTQQSLGSGTLIAKGDGWGAVISAGHVFSDGSDSVKCKFLSGNEYDGVLVASLLKSNAVDLAIIELTSCPEEPVATIAPEAPKVGDKLAFAGFGSPSQDYRAMGGKLLRYTAGARGAANQFYMTGGARQGDSGGPIFNLEGQFVGVLWGTDGAGTIGTYNGQIETFAACSDRYDFPWNRDNRAGRRAPDESMPLPPAPEVEMPVTPKAPAVDVSALADIKAKLAEIAGKVGTDSPGLSGVLGEVQKVGELKNDLGELKDSIAALQEVAGNPKSLEELQAMLDALRVVSDKVGSVSENISELQALPASVRDTASTVAATQESVAELREAQDEAIATASRFQGVVSKVMWWFGLPASCSAAVWAIFITALLVRRDFRDRRKTGDPLAIRKAADALNSNLLGMVAGGVETVQDRVDKRAAQAIGLLEAVAGGAVDKVGDLRTVLRELVGLDKPAPPADPPSTPAA